MEVKEALDNCLLMDNYEFPFPPSDNKVTVTISSLREYDKLDRKHDLRYHSDRGGAKYLTKIGEKTGRWRNKEALINTCTEVAKALFPNREIEYKDTTR